MPYILKGSRVLITGGSRGLGAAIARAFAREGADISINYHSNVEAAKEVTDNLAQEFNVKTACVRGDVGNADDCVSIVNETVSALHGLDIIVSNAAWTEFSNFADLDALDAEKWNKCWTTNVMGNLNLFRAAKPIMIDNADGGVFIYTASIAGKSVSGSSMAYSVTKAAALHLMQCLAQTQSHKIRVNSVIPGLLLTDWGNRYSSEFIAGWKEDTPLKRIPEVDDAAEMFISIASNLSLTGAEIPIDSGWLIAH